MITMRMIPMLITMARTRKIIRPWLRIPLAIGLLSCMFLSVTVAFALVQEPPAAQQSDQASTEKAATAKSDAEKPSQPEGEANQAEHQPKGIGGVLAKETREAEGEEEHADLKHSSMVQKLAKLTGMNVHQAHLFALGLNFAIIVFLIFWFARKSVPGMLRSRSASIQKALEEARTASQEAGRRLADIENRLREMDVEIGRMQASAEKEAEGEEARIQKAAEEELRKVVQAAEQEIAAAAKQVRRELSTHTADLALALARKQINVDSNTDQVLIRNFASKLASKPPSQGEGGKDGR
jgi:F-type H+-transporting ATPase subunit b